MSVDGGEEGPKVSFYDDALYAKHTSPRTRTPGRQRPRKPKSKSPEENLERRHLLASDGTLGYGGTEYSLETFNLATAPSDCKYKWKLLWKDVDPILANNVLMDRVSCFSVTDTASADLMSNTILDLPGITKNSTITDATACIGGNTYSFLKNFKLVNAIELDPSRFKILQFNVQLFAQVLFPHQDESTLEGRDGSKSKTLKALVRMMQPTNSKEEQHFALHQGNCLSILPQLSQDVIFFDPPWGGETYKSRGEIKLFLSSVDIGDVCKQVSKYAKFLAVKIPVSNVDINGIVASSGCDLQGVYPIGKKMRLLVLQNPRFASEEELSFMKSIGLRLP